MLKGLGVPARDAQMILGHSTVTVTLGIYSEVFDAEITSALTKMDDALTAVRIDDEQPDR
jgi:integrase